MLVPDERLNALTGTILNAAIDVHRALGPGLFESVYDRCMQIEMQQRGIGFTTQPRVPLVYKGEQLHVAYRADFLVENEVVVELKAVEMISPVHKAQVITYLRLGGYPPGS